MPSLAIVILNWNGKQLLQRFLPSVVENSPGAQIIVADNGSSDNSIDFLEEHYPEVGIIKNQKNYGFAGGYNEALKEVDADLICLLNSDVEVTKGWLAPVLELLAKNPDIGIVQPKIKDLKRPTYFEYAGAAGGFLDYFGYPFCRAHRQRPCRSHRW